MATHKHPILRRILPARLFRAIEQESREWIVECPCGHRRDYWDAGGVRYKSRGVGLTEYAECPACGKKTWHSLRRKTEQETEKVS